MEGANITLEWKYTFSKEESFRQALFDMDKDQLLDKFASDDTPWITPSHRGRIYANITNNYTSITLLGVNRLDKGTYTLRVSANPHKDRTTSEVEISVLCK